MNIVETRQISNIYNQYSTSPMANHVNPAEVTQTEINSDAEKTAEEGTKTLELSKRRSESLNKAFEKHKARESHITENMITLCARALASPHIARERDKEISEKKDNDFSSHAKSEPAEIRELVVLKGMLSERKHMNASRAEAIQIQGSPKIRVIQSGIEPFYNPRNIVANPDTLQENLSTLSFQFSRLVVDNALARENGQPIWGEELAEKHWEAIGSTRDNYLEIFLKAFEKMNGFYEDFIEFKNKIPDWIGATDDKGNVSFNATAFNEAIEALINKYSSPSPDAQLYPETGKGDSKEACENWIKQMGLSSENCLVQRADGSWAVTIDITALKNIKSSAPDSNQNASKFAAWESAFNSQGDTLQNNMQMFTQKMSSANSIYENLVKIFSSFIEQDLNAARSYLNF